MRLSTLHLRGDISSATSSGWNQWVFLFRGVAQLVARTAGGREVASSSLVIPTIRYNLISMTVVRSNTTESFENSKACKGYSFPNTGNEINGAIISVAGRYPVTGFLVNEVCKELVYITKGSGKLTLTGESQTFNKGDVVYIENGEKFAWEGDFEGFFVCTPTFYPEQHKEVAV